MREREGDVERLGRQHNNSAVDEVAIAHGDEQHATLIAPHRHLRYFLSSARDLFMTI